AVARLGTVRFRRSSDTYLVGIVFLPDHKTLMTADGDRVQFWEVKTGRLARQLDVHPWSIRSFALSADAKLFAIAGLDPLGHAEIRVFDTASGKPVRVFSRSGHKDVDGSRLAFSPDGKLLFSLGESGMLRVEDLATGEERWQHKFSIEHVGGLIV